MKKRVFKAFMLIAALALVALASAGVYFLAVTRDVRLVSSALEMVEARVKICYAGGEEMDLEGYVQKAPTDIESLPDYVKNAFIATEDKRFYSHHGLDYIRMGSAIISNIKRGKLAEGGSTISQQLIKNTHLSQEKTLERKLKEIRLAKKLERRYSKDEILQMYLSSIYFGNGCYGIEKAAHYYFDKGAKDLSLGEAALLAATINAPSIYDPISKPEKAEKRKTLVLKNMLKEGYITEEEFSKNANSAEKIVKTASKRPNEQIKCVLEEAARIMKISEKELMHEQIEIRTNLLKELDEPLFAAAKIPADLGEDLPFALLVINSNKQVVGALYHGCTLDRKRQPGSTIKPLAVYAPALEENLICPESIVVDEPICIDGYSPSNANKSFSGPVSIRTAVEKSLNIPAVKLLSDLGVDRAKSALSRLGINSKNEGLALALGGMQDGVTLRQLADGYSALSTSGEYGESSLISQISRNGHVVYRERPRFTRALSPETAYIMTDLLKGVTTSGTGRRLSSLAPLASKTGTVGVKGKSLNTDAYMIAYNRDWTVAAWIGAGPDGMPSSINGSSYPAEMVKAVFSHLGKSEDFEMPQGVTMADIDARSLAEGRVELASPTCPVYNKKLALMSESFKATLSSRTLPPAPTLDIEMEQSQKPLFSFVTSPATSYTLLRRGPEGERAVFEVVGDGSAATFCDQSARAGTLYEYYLVSEEGGQKRLSRSVKLISF